MPKVVFNEVPAQSFDLLVIAGEYSGDEHAARWTKVLKTQYPQYNIAAIGGHNLREANTDFLFNLVDFSVIGLVEVLKNIRFFSNFLKKTCDWIEQYRPKVVCFVDFPGMNLRIAKELFRRGISHKAGGDVKLYHYISPQIWAWKAKRRFVIAKYIDALGTIFPFEPNCYRDTDLDVQFLGHPFLLPDYKFPVAYHADGPFLLLPGSRKAAVKRIFPIMLDTIKHFQKLDKMRGIVVIYPDDKILEILQKIRQKYNNISVSFIRSGSQKISASVALMSSGTMALNCALEGIPSMIIYKVNFMTYWLAKFLIKVKFLHMANILLNRESACEFLQFKAKPKRICDTLWNASHDLTIRLQAQKDAEVLRQILSANAQNDVVNWIQKALT
jgi:lipid-A-disaccharide synthase